MKDQSILSHIIHPTSQQSVVKWTHIQQHGRTQVKILCINRRSFRSVEASTPVSIRLIIKLCRISSISDNILHHVIRMHRGNQVFSVCVQLNSLREIYNYVEYYTSQIIEVKHNNLSPNINKCTPANYQPITIHRRLSESIQWWLLYISLKFIAHSKMHLKKATSKPYGVWERVRSSHHQVNHQKQQEEGRM